MRVRGCCSEERRAGGGQVVLGDKVSKRAGGRDDRAKGGKGAPSMRMTKAGAAAGIWRYGRETSGGERRHRQRATSAHGGWEETDNGEA